MSEEAALKSFDWGEYKMLFAQGLNVYLRCWRIFFQNIWIIIMLWLFIYYKKLLLICHSFATCNKLWFLLSLSQKAVILNKSSRKRFLYIVFVFKNKAKLCSTLFIFYLILLIRACPSVSRPIRRDLGSCSRFPCRAELFGWLTTSLAEGLLAGATSEQVLQTNTNTGRGVTSPSLTGYLSFSYELTCLKAWGRMSSWA